MNDMLFNTLNNWVDRYYRDRLTAADLADPQLLREGREALDTLTQLLNLGSVYPFQQEDAPWITFWLSRSQAPLQRKRKEPFMVLTGSGSGTEFWN
jgi:hypothetical protein